MRRAVVWVVFVALAFVVAGCRFDLPDAAECPARYVPLTGGTPGHVYLKGTSAVTWYRADDGCLAIGGHVYLAVPNDTAELRALHTLAANTFWIGIHDRINDGMFVEGRPGNMDAPATFLPWATGEPDGGATQACVAATATAISTESCDTAVRPFVCECEP